MDRISLNMKEKLKGIPSFLRKTLDILEDSANSKMICWATDGRGFTILNEEEFSQVILPRYFKHNNYSSFVRQLNMYNFHKLRDNKSQASYFYHQLFRRDNMQQKMIEIKRKPQRKRKKIGQGQSNEEPQRKRGDTDGKYPYQTRTSESGKQIHSEQIWHFNQDQQEISIVREIDERPLVVDPQIQTIDLICPSKGNLCILAQRQPDSTYSLSNLLR